MGAANVGLALVPFTRSPMPLDALWQTLTDPWPGLVPLVYVVSALAATAHALTHKRQTHSAIGWIGVIWLSPLLGVGLYAMLGVNRIRRDAKLLRQGRGVWPADAEAHHAAALDPAVVGLVDLARVGRAITDQPLLAGNRVQLFGDGDPVFAQMLQAIRTARRSVALCTYIFDDDAVGRAFVEALLGARDRGVEVRVLVDAAGARYTQRPVDAQLRRKGLRAARFLPANLPWSVRYFNLRNHRKVLICDGAIGFTGGMNLRAGHGASTASAENRVIDEHFRLDGPVVRQLVRVFAEDWAFTTGEALAGPAWFPPLAAAGTAAARAIADGPDEDFETRLECVLGALACARSEVLLATPYFLPDPVVLHALGTTSRRGVDLRVVLPARTNITLAQWAAQGLLGDVLDQGVEVWLAPDPFAHSKLLVIDRRWTLLGSGNWDPRSFQLNFELDVEVYDPALAEACARRLEARMNAGQELTRDVLNARSLAARLRDGAARLLSPYL